MITEASGFQIGRAPDLFKANECLKLPARSESGHVLGLAAITVLRVSDPRRRAEDMWACIRRAREIVLSRFESHRAWIYVCECGEDSRIFTQRKIWRGLSLRGIEFHGRTTAESLRRNNDGSLCFYGAAEIDSDDPEQVRKLVSPASRSFLAWVPPETDPDVEGVVSAGWHRGFASLHELRDVALALCARGGIVLRVFGEFDDRETGVDCIMDVAMFERCRDT